MTVKLETLKCMPFCVAVLTQSWKLIVFCLLFFVCIYFLFGALFATLLIICGIGLFFYSSQDRLLYHPDDKNHQSRVHVLTPESVDLPFQNLFIKSLDGTLIHLYFIRQPEPHGSQAPTVVYFHGNAGNMGHRLQNAAGMYSSLSCNILMVEYRGYGLSRGYATENGIHMDSQAAMNYLASRPDVNQNRIVVFGRSLGGAVAIDLAARAEFSSRIWCLIVENTFTSIPDMTAALFKYRWLRYVPLFAYKNKLMSKKKILSVTVPTLFISGLRDSLVPPSMMSELHSMSPAPLKLLIQVPNGEHNDTWIAPSYYSTIAEFLEAAQAYTPSPPSTSAIEV